MTHSPSLQSDGSIPEKLCKIDAVQRQLAWLQGIIQTALIVCDFAPTIPFSFLAERWGVRFVLLCNLVPRLLLLGPFLAVLGRGCVFQSAVFTLTSALAGDHVQRASYFSYITSTSYVVSFLGPTLASFTMSKSLWLPFWMITALLTCAVPVVRLLSNTQKTSFAPFAPMEIPVSSEDVEPLLGNSRSSPVPVAKAFASPSSTFPCITNTDFPYVK